LQFFCSKILRDSGRSTAAGTMMHFPRVLVLGATGQIGRILQICWPGRVNALWQTRQGCPGPDECAQWVRFDPLSDSVGLQQAAADCDVILCLSGVTHKRCQADPQADMDDNTRLALAAIRAAAARPVPARVLLASSAAVYGNQPGLLSEAAPLHPVNAYGAAKAEMEARGAALGAELGVQVCSLRIGNIAGVDAILGGWRPGFRLDRFADGRSPRRSYTGVATLARVLGELPGMPNLPGALNIAEPGLVEMGELLDAAGLAWQPQEAPETAIPEVELDVTSLQRLCPWLPGRSEAARLVEEWRRLQG